MTEEEKLLSGRLFNPKHPELAEIKQISHNLCTQYNQTYEDDPQRGEIMGKILKKMGSNVFFQGPIWFNYGCHTTVGSNVFVNYNFVVLDDAPVMIGDRFMAGPNVTIATVMHPMIASERISVTDEAGNSFGPCYAKPTVIGNQVWVASGTVICAGVTIGDDVVIGAGSVVSKDIPSGVFAAGSPCRVIREITEADTVFNLTSF